MASTKPKFGTYGMYSTPPPDRIPKPQSTYHVPGTVGRISNPIEEGMRVQRNLASKARRY